VGPKTASKWLQQYGDLDSLLQQSESVKGKAGETLRAHQEQVLKSLELTRLRDDVALPQNWDELELQASDEQALQAFAERYGFRSWLK
ncbi:MAG: 5'-3' exonuclease H3TH domain-containing protein, partial [Oceanococcaceae bacterium]